MWRIILHGATLNKESYFIWSLHNLLRNFNSPSIKIAWQSSLYILMHFNEMLWTDHFKSYEQKANTHFLDFCNYNIISRWLNNLVLIHYLYAAPTNVFVPLVFMLLTLWIMPIFVVDHPKYWPMGSNTTFVDLFLWFYSLVLGFTARATYYCT